MRQALLIIDMQRACLATPRFQAAQVIANINQLASHFRANNKPVIFIQHQDGSAEFSAGSDGWQFIDEIPRAASDQVVAKSVCDGFFQTQLGAVLAAEGVTQVLITGCATDFCVDATLKGALGQGLNVVAVADAHTTADRPHATASQLIAHYNWMWANLITGSVGMQVKATTELLSG